MCFLNDYDWYAAVSEELDTVAAKTCKCQECRAVIKAGEFLHTIHQQEYEDCQACDEDFCSCETPDFGETFDWHWCENCDKFLRAVKQAELEAGCSESEARPSMPFRDDIQELGRKEAEKYWTTARRMFPEIGPYLDNLWDRMFGGDE